MKIATLIATVGALVSCVVVSTEQMSDIDQNVGWLHGNCLAIKNANIESPKKLTLVNLESKPTFHPALITDKAQSGDECYALIEDRKIINIGNGYSFYKVESNSPVNLAVGFLKLENPNMLVFDYCTTTEGVVFAILKSENKIWEGYYYLGYDSEATCDE